MVGERMYAVPIRLFHRSERAGLVSRCRKRWYLQAYLQQEKPRRLSLDDGSGVVVDGGRGARGVGVR